MHPHQHYWRLELEICRIAAGLGLKKAEMLKHPLSLPGDMRRLVESMLWEQVRWLEKGEQVAKYGFLEKELVAELKSAHHVYRAVRAAYRLNQEGELFLSERQQNLARRLEQALRQFYDAGSDCGGDSLPLTQAKRFITELRSRFGDTTSDSKQSPAAPFLSYSRR